MPRNSPGDPTSAHASSEPPRGVGRWLAFLPSLLIFLVAARTSGNAGDEQLYFHDELLAAGFIAAFLALLWVASKRIAQPRAAKPLGLSRGRGFDVIAGEDRGDARGDR